ncbi:MAG TPA: dihydroneopterin aldolase [Alphaproteobacteria bacterium]|nr:dihydroneopterin aldolase [Alphaproteobacteria bacterium]
MNSGKIVHFGARPGVVSDRLTTTQPTTPGILRVFVRDLVLPCRIGVYRHEKEGPQRVRINLDLLVKEPGEDLHDEVARVVSYETVTDAIRTLCAGPHINLVETLAERIADICFKDARVRSVTVRVEKLDIFQDAESAGVEIARERA